MSNYGREDESYNNRCSRSQKEQRKESRQKSINKTNEIRKPNSADTFIWLVVQFISWHFLLVAVTAAHVCVCVHLVTHKFIFGTKLTRNKYIIKIIANSLMKRTCKWVARLVQDCAKGFINAEWSARKREINGCIQLIYYIRIKTTQTRNIHVSGIIIIPGMMARRTIGDMFQFFPPFIFGWLNECTLQWERAHTHTHIRPQCEVSGEHYSSLNKAKCG